MSCPMKWNVGVGLAIGCALAAFFACKQCENFCIAAFVFGVAAFGYALEGNNESVGVTSAKQKLLLSTAAGLSTAVPFFIFAAL